MMNQIVSQHPQYEVKVTSEVDIFPTQGDRNTELLHIVNNGWLTITGIDKSIDALGNHFGHLPLSAVYVGGEPDADNQRLLDGTRLALEAGIAAAKNGNCMRDLSGAVEKVGQAHKLGIVRDFVGHGCGIRLHEPPDVPNFTTPGSGIKLLPGMVLAIEPMFNLGTYKVYVEKDNWTVRTADGKRSAHFEHMVLIGEDQTEVLTRG